MSPHLENRMKITDYITREQVCPTPKKGEEISFVTIEGGILVVKYGIVKDIIAGVMLKIHNFKTPVSIGRLLTEEEQILLQLKNAIKK